MSKTLEPWVVEASFDETDLDKADCLKKLVRKPVTFSGGGGRRKRDIGWCFATHRGALAAARRLRQRGRVQVEVYDLRAA